MVNCYDDPDWLYDQYVVKKKSFNTIACECNVSIKVIWKRIHKFGIEVRPFGWHNVGTHLSEETKKKISESNIGKHEYLKDRKVSDETKMKISIANTGRKLSEDTRKNMSLAKRGKSHVYSKTPEETSIKKSVAMSGKNNPNYGRRKELHWNWKGGITPNRQKDCSTFEYKEWRRQVYSRDEFSCTICGTRKSGTLNAHHLYNFSEYREFKMIVDNGITMCKYCHKDFHDRFGYTNNNPNQIIDYIIDNYN